MRTRLQELCVPSFGKGVNLHDYRILVTNGVPKISVGVTPFHRNWYPEPADLAGFAPDTKTVSRLPSGKTLLARIMKGVHMKVFISWSGELSYKIAMILRDWIPTVMHTIDTWVSTEDIAKGSRWGLELGKVLEESYYGVICIVPGNVDEPWLNFEAGVISKSLNAARVCPFVFGLTPKQITGPLGQFQCTEYSKEDIRRLVYSLNQSNPAGSIPIDRLDRTFELCWPALKSSLDPLRSADLPIAGGRVTYLKGRNQVYAHALYLYKSVEQRVRVLQFFGGPRPPQEYAEEAAKILRAKRDSGVEVTFDAYLAVNPSEAPPNFHEANQKRIDIYSSHGVGDLVRVHFLEMKYPKGFGFDMFIVDRKHAHISFTTSERLEALQRGIAFENQEIVVNDLAEWFERAVEQNAKPYEIWTREHQNVQS